MANPWDNDPIVGGKTSSPEEFSKVYGPVAERISKAIGVDKAVVLGQLGLETGWGKSIIPGTHNLGNIKDFAGGGVGATDNMTGSRDKYRAYESPEDFADDYASLIQRKYPGAVNAGADASKFTAGLKGYAEDPRYPTKVAAAAKIAGAKGGNPWDNDPIVEAEPASAKPAQPAAEPGIGTKILRGVGGVLGPGQVIADLATGGRFSRDEAAGLVRGAGSIGSTLARPFESSEENKQRRASIDSFMEDAGADPRSFAYGGGKLAAEVAGTAGVGNALGAPLRAMGPAGTAMNRLGTALSTAGATTGAPVAQGIAPAVGNMLLRMGGGAGAGYAGAGLIDPETRNIGAAVGAALPPATRLVGAIANGAGALVRPFTSGGQQKIAGNVLREFATDPAAARAAMQQTQQIVPGSAPTAATASGDAGIAAVTRSMEGASPSFAADMAARQTAQNQSRTALLESVAGNTGKISTAKAARDASTGPMREAVLDAAGQVPSAGILQSIDRQLANPNNAGQLAQQALTQFRNRIAQFSPDGAIDARALYAIRKDINDVLGGKLQGEAGNIRHAAGQLTGVKNLIDDAIDQASSRVSPGPVAGAPLSTSREIVPFVASTEVGAPAGSSLAIRQGGQVGPAMAGGAPGGASARPTWRGYLQSYADQSIPIRQMEKLDEILKSVQTGTVDSQGSAILSAAKLNNLLKNQGSDLVKDLSPQQLQILRNIQADLNANQIAANVGKAGRSDTFQNFAQNQLLESALGKSIGGSTAASSTLGRLLQLPYGAANKQIQERLGNALLNPQEAAAMLAEPGGNALLRAFQNSAIPYKAVPAISSR